MSQEISVCPLIKVWNKYEQADNLDDKKKELSNLKETAINHDFITPVTQLRNQQENITYALIVSINELEASVNQEEINLNKCKQLELKVQEAIFSHLEFEKTISDFKSEQSWKMTRIVLLVLLVFIFTTIFMTFIYNSAKRRAKKAREFNNQIIQVQEEERQRLSRELHDTVTQDIRTSLLYVRTLKERQQCLQPEEKELMEKIENLETQNLINIRNIIQNLISKVIRFSGN